MVRVNKKYWLLLLGGLVIRLLPLAQSFWYDESYTFWLSKLSFDAMINATAGDVHPPLFYIITWCSAHLFGPSELSARLPSLIFGMASIEVARRILNRLDIAPMTRIVSLFAITASPVLTYYATEARMYSQLLFFILCAVLVLLSGDKFHLFGFWLAMAMYSHNMTALYVLPLGLCYLYINGLKKTVIAGVAFSVIYAPWVPVLLSQLNNVSSGYWILPISTGRVVRVLNSLIFGDGVTESVPLVAAPILLSLLLAGTVTLRKNAVLLAWAFGPLAVCVTVSLFTPLLIPRILIATTPALLILVAQGIVFLMRYVKPVTLSPLLLVVIAGVVSLYPIRADLRIHYKQIPISIGDKCYHINASSLVIGEYTIPACDHYLWSGAADSLYDGLSEKTRQAMGMKEVTIDDLSGTIWLIHYSGSQIDTVEYVERNRILTTFSVLDEIALTQHPIAGTTAWKIGGHLAAYPR